MVFKALDFTSDACHYPYLGVSVSSYLRHSVLIVAVVAEAVVVAGTNKDWGSECEPGQSQISDFAVHGLLLLLLLLLLSLLLLLLLLLLNIYYIYIQYISL
jgi:hypothetical protein